MTPFWQIYEQPPEWYWKNWPTTVPLRAMIGKWDLVQEVGTGLWFRYPDTGERVHLLKLLPCLDGWTPDSLRSAKYKEIDAMDPDHSYVEYQIATGDVLRKAPNFHIEAPALAALVYVARHRKQTADAAKAPRRSKWQHLRDRVGADAIKLSAENPTLAESYSATAKALIRVWVAEGVTEIPSPDTVRRWISAIQYPPVQKVER